MLLERRDCVVCPSSPPSCDCKAGQQCSLTLQSCSECAQVICSGGSDGNNHAGTIAGSVIGGLVGLALIIGLFYWFKFRKYRHQTRLDGTLSPDMASDHNGPIVDPSGVHRGSKAISIDSVNTSQARGSNVIPIAYIPGVNMLQQRQSQNDAIRASVATSDYRASLPDFVMAIHGQPSLVEVGGSQVQWRNDVNAERQNSQRSYTQRMPSGASRATSFKRTGSGAAKSADSASSESLATVGSVVDDSSFSQESMELGQRVDEAFSSVGGNMTPFTFDTLDTSANSGKSMVTIPEDPEETDHVTTSTATPVQVNQQPVIARVRLDNAKMRERGSDRFSNYSDPRHSMYPTRQSSMRSGRQPNFGQDRSSRYSRASSTREYNMYLPEEAYLYYNNLDEN